MKARFKDFLHSLGIFYQHPGLAEELPYKKYQKQNDQIDKLKEHRDFLKNLEEDEQKRLESIETKGSQFIVQVGVIFTLLSLFIPIIMDKASSFNIIFKIVLICLLVSAALLYVLSIHNALKNYRVSDFNYVRPSASNVLDFKDETLEAFVAEQIRDYLFGRVNNIHNNNKKATNLLHAYLSFKYANILTGCLIVFFSITTVTYRAEKNIIYIEEPVVVKDLDRILKELKDNNKKDTTIISVINNTKAALKK
jgi:hypothetical protein